MPAVLGLLALGNGHHPSVVHENVDVVTLEPLRGRPGSPAVFLGAEALLEGLYVRQIRQIQPHFPS